MYVSLLLFFFIVSPLDVIFPVWVDNQIDFTHFYEQHL